MTREERQPTQHQCPVCGYLNLNEQPRSAENGASYEICPSCLFHFGYDDESQGITDAEWRQDWINGGMPWCSTGQPPPDGWDPIAQLATLPDDRAQ